uniref:C2H2-type domain-containing protein n=1 Tax=Octopus bimaculoides TaxID=37653 RepID=A0A0L8GG66_OCTBM
MADSIDPFGLNISKSEHSFSPVLSGSTTNGVSSLSTLSVNASKDVRDAQFVPINHASSINDAEESSIERSSDHDDEPVECGECNKEFLTLQEYMEHPCARSESGSRVGREENQGSISDNELSDGESFDGRIVYNPDGSAYIIEGADSDQSDIDSIVDVPQQEGSIIVKKGKVEDSKASVYPQIANAFFVPRNTASFFNNFYMVSAQKYMPDAPIMHSYRVYDVRSAKKDLLNEGKSGDDCSESNEKSAIRCEDSISTSNAGAATVPTKPILMCFICKLSFGYTKSFIAHAIGEHSMDLNEEEKAIMSRKNASAIIQGVGKHKKPLMSFLEPNPTPVPETTVLSNPRHLTNSHPTSTVCSTSVDKDSSTSVIYSHGRPNTSEKLTSSRHFHPQNCSIPSQDLTSHITHGLSANSEAAITSAAATTLSSTQLQLATSVGCQLTPAAVETTTTAAVTPEISNPHNEASIGDSKVPSSSSPSSSSHLELERATVSDSVPLPYSESNHIERTNSHTFLTSPIQGIPGFLGSCDEHPQGRAHGVECPKCDMILSSSQSLGGHMTMMHSRNSCKTLKCPKCNWHYKYQETLEIHMKEKHPENDAQCIYCVTNQPHPRLARGETYACGYKPYRCEVCNYSTTTKGNLSIHMQSDKHLNNVQELANGGDIKLQTQSFNQENAQLKKNKPKPTWRCDVCNYETNVARNLRIHMTSEKHTHNMLALQQNMKQMQGDMSLHMNPVLLLGQQDPALLNLQSSLSASNSQFSFDQPLIQQGTTRNFEIPVDLSKENDLSCFSYENDEKLAEGAMMLHCCVCNIFTSDTIDMLSHHLNIDRTKQHETDDIIISAGMYMCNLCTYKTNLKTNFYLHLKTDKHLQRLQLVNHIKEGGANNEWRLKYLTVNNPVLVRCNACEFCTNSIHKLQMHANTEAHETCAQLFHHLASIEMKIPVGRREFVCTLCNFSARSKCQMFHHAKCMKHAQNDSLRQLQLQEQGKCQPMDLSEIFIVREYMDDNIPKMSDSGALFVLLREFGAIIAPEIN